MTSKNWNGKRGRRTNFWFGNFDRDPDQFARALCSLNIVDINSLITVVQLLHTKNSKGMINMLINLSGNRSIVAEMFTGDDIEEIKIILTDATHTRDEGYIYIDTLSLWDLLEKLKKINTISSSSLKGMRKRGEIFDEISILLNTEAECIRY